MCIYTHMYIYIYIYIYIYMYMNIDPLQFWLQVLMLRCWERRAEWPDREVERPSKLDEAPLH
jgi:hypothetical protein